MELTSNMTCIKDAVNFTIVWPANKVILKKILDSEVVDNANSLLVK